MLNNKINVLQNIAVAQNDYEREKDHENCQKLINEVSALE